MAYYSESSQQTAMKRDGRGKCLVRDRVIVLAAQGITVSRRDKKISFLRQVSTENFGVTCSHGAYGSVQEKVSSLKKKLRILSLYGLLLKYEH